MDADLQRVGRRGEPPREQPVAHQGLDRHSTAEPRLPDAADAEEYLRRSVLWTFIRLAVFKSPAAVQSSRGDLESFHINVRPLNKRQGPNSDQVLGYVVGDACGLRDIFEDLDTEVSEALLLVDIERGS